MDLLIKLMTFASPFVRAGQRQTGVWSTTEQSAFIPHTLGISQGL